MRTFWAIMVVLAAIAAAMFLLPSGSGPATPTLSADQPSEDADRTPAANPSARDSSPRRERPAPAEQPSDEPASTSLQSLRSADGTRSAEDLSPQPADAEADAEGVLEDMARDIAPARDPRRDHVHAEHRAQPSPGFTDTGGASWVDVLLDGEIAKVEDPASAGSRPRRTAPTAPSGPRSYEVTGNGSKSDPFVVTWEHLISAQETYKPRQGQEEIPPHVQKLDGSWVKITGFVAFPLMAESADEMLMMLNQWDGCCIGVPPTPYDAIEVRLADDAEGDDRFTTYGSVVGRLAVDPYLVGDWLVGLYVMERGVLEPEEQGGFFSTP